MPRRRALFTAAALTFSVVPAFAQSSAKDDWRLLVYDNLAQPSSLTASYTDLWSDQIDANDRAYIAQGDAQYSSGHAPASEAHFVVRSPERAAVLSILDTATGCTTITVFQDVNIIVRSCPLKIAIYENGSKTVTEGRRGCFLELTAQKPGEPISGASYAAFDPKTRSIKIGTIVNHKPVPECQATIPLYERIQP